MACGLPVIISDQVGIYHEVTRARAGLVVSCQVESLAAAMMRMVQLANLRRQMGANGRRLVQERFSLDVTTLSLVELYDQVVHCVMGVGIA